MLRIAFAVFVVVVSLVATELGYRRMLRAEGRFVPVAEDAFVLYGVGESTMTGQPYGESVSPILLTRTLLGGRIAGRPIDVHNLAQPSSGIISQGLRFESEVALRDRAIPGAVLIYSGHNEGFGGREQRGGLLSLVGDVHLLRYSAALTDLLVYLEANRIVAPPEGMHHRTERFLRRVIESALRAGLVPVLFTLPSNIARIEPNARLSEMPEVRAVLEAGAGLETAGEIERALAYYRHAYDSARALGRPSAPLLLYRAARCAEALGDYETARRDYWSAVDSDSRQNFGRATTAQNALVRSLGVEYRIPVVDVVSVFEQAAPHGILADDLFADGHHPNLEGYRLLAEACVARLAEVFPAKRIDGLADVDEIVAALDISAGQLRSAHMTAGSWLVSTSALHPWPRDRMALAQAHFRAAASSQDDVSALLGLAIAQASRDGTLLTDDGVVAELGRANFFYADSFSIPPEVWAKLSARLRERGVDESLVTRIDALLAHR